MAKLSLKKFMIKIPRKFLNNKAKFSVADQDFGPYGNHLIILIIYFLFIIKYYNFFLLEKINFH